MKSKSISLVLGIILAFSMVGCGQKTATESTEAQSQAEDTQKVDQFLIRAWILLKAL